MASTEDVDSSVGPKVSPLLDDISARYPSFTPYLPDWKALKKCIKKSKDGSPEAMSDLMAVLNTEYEKVALLIDDEIAPLIDRIDVLTNLSTSSTSSSQNDTPPAGTPNELDSRTSSRRLIRSLSSTSPLPLSATAGVVFAAPTSTLDVALTDARRAHAHLEAVSLLLTALACIFAKVQARLPPQAFPAPPAYPLSGLPAHTRVTLALARLAEGGAAPTAPSPLDALAQLARAHAVELRGFMVLCQRELQHAEQGGAATALSVLRRHAERGELIREYERAMHEAIAEAPEPAPCSTSTSASASASASATEPELVTLALPGVDAEDEEEESKDKGGKDGKEGKDKKKKNKKAKKKDKELPHPGPDPLPLPPSASARTPSPASSDPGPASLSPLASLARLARPRLVSPPPAALALPSAPASPLTLPSHTNTNTNPDADADATPQPPPGSGPRTLWFLLPLVEHWALQEAASFADANAREIDLLYSSSRFADLFTLALLLLHLGLYSAARSAALLLAPVVAVAMGLDAWVGPALCVLSAAAAVLAETLSSVYAAPRTPAHPFARPATGYGSTSSSAPAPHDTVPATPPRYRRALLGSCLAMLIASAALAAAPAFQLPALVVAAAALGMGSVGAAAKDLITDHVPVYRRAPVFILAGAAERIGAVLAPAALALLALAHAPAMADPLDPAAAPVPAPVAPLALLVLLSWLLLSALALFGFSEPPFRPEVELPPDHDEEAALPSSSASAAEPLLGRSRVGSLVNAAHLARLTRAGVVLTRVPPSPGKHTRAPSQPRSPPAAPPAPLPPLPHLTSASALAPPIAALVASHAALAVLALAAVPLAAVGLGWSFLAAMLAAALAALLAGLAAPLAAALASKAGVRSASLLAAALAAALLAQAALIALPPGDGPALALSAPAPALHEADTVYVSDWVPPASALSLEAPARTRPLAFILATAVLALAAAAAAGLAQAVLAQHDHPVAAHSCLRPHRAHALLRAAATGLAAALVAAALLPVQIPAAAVGRQVADPMGTLVLAAADMGAPALTAAVMGPLAALTAGALAAVLVKHDRLTMRPLFTTMQEG